MISDDERRNYPDKSEHLSEGVVSFVFSRLLRCGVYSMVAIMSC